MVFRRWALLRGLAADSNEGGHLFQSDRGHHSNLIAVDNPLGGLGYSLWRDGALEWFSAGRGAGPADLVVDPANHELPSVIRVGLVGSPRVTRK